MGKQDDMKTLHRIVKDLTGNKTYSNAHVTKKEKTHAIVEGREVWWVEYFEESLNHLDPGSSCKFWKWTSFLVSRCKCWYNYQTRDEYYYYQNE